MSNNCSPQVFSRTCAAAPPSVLNVNCCTLGCSYLVFSSSCVVVRVQLVLDVKSCTTCSQLVFLRACAAVVSVQYHPQYSTLTVVQLGRSYLVFSSFCVLFKCPVQRYGTWRQQLYNCLHLVFSRTRAAVVSVQRPPVLNVNCCFSRSYFSDRP